MKTRKHHTPPSWALRLLKRACPDDLYEMIEGDLIEQFEDNIREIGPVKARRIFVWSTIRFFCLYFLKKKRLHSSGQAAMMLHHMVTACRHFRRHKMLSAINVVGLAVAFVAFFSIAQYVSFENSYEDFHDNKGQVYRVAYYYEENGHLKLASATNFIGIATLVKEHLPQVAAVTTFDHTARDAYFQFIYNDKTFHQQTPFFQTDENFFKVFPSLLAQGDPGSVLSDPHNLVLSKKMATMIFGTNDPIGKKIENRSYGYSQVGSFVVSGVMIDVPENSHFHLDFIAKDSYDEEFAQENLWAEPRFYAYLSLSPGTDPWTVETRINALLKGLNAENPKTKGVTVKLQQISDIHNHSNLAEELEPNGNGNLLYIISLIGVAMIVCAWINYVNIETGSLLSRTKEIHVRKILGSGWSNLTAQFFTEYIMTTSIALAIACSALFVFKQRFNELLGLPDFKYWSSPVWQGAFIFFLCGIILVGIFPGITFVKQRLQTVTLSKISRSSYNSPFKQVLISFQFICSISLIAIIMIVNDQLALIMTSDKKIDIENIVSFRNPTVYTDEDSASQADYSVFRNELLSNGIIKEVTGLSAIPGMEVEVAFINRIKRNPGDPYDVLPYKILFIDYDYIPFYNLKLKAGRNYSIDSGDDESWTTVILNETSSRALGFASAEQAIDQEVYFHLFGDDFKKFKIIGVVEDYYNESARKEIQPTILSLNHRYFQQVFFSAKINKGSDPQEALSFIERTWKSLYPDKPFDYFFQDEYYDRQFKSERRFSTVFGLFTGVTLLIASLGIVGMTLFETNLRLKEVTVRKVLGASVTSLVAMLTVGYLRIATIATVCCAPIIFYFSETWLSLYKTRIEMSAWFYIIPLIAIVMLIALSSGWQTIKTSMANPVDHLRDE